MIAFVSATFLSAFLLFQLQPLIARFILPAYGGSPAVWTSCMMFFQVALLAGYLYAHLLSRYAPPKRQPIVHLVMVALSLLLLPVGLPDGWTPGAGGEPAVEILVLLGLSVGIPFVLISASAPLLQHWFASAHPGRSPFRLYAVSNLGSLLALLSYPFVVEPALTLDSQAKVWSVGYAALFVACIGCGVAYFGSDTDTAPVEQSSAGARPVTLLDRLLWIALAACGSTLLLAVTNQICQDVAVVPFLWIVPLSLYLVSFIICFDKDAWYRRGIWIPLLFVSVVITVDVMMSEFSDDTASFLAQVLTFNFMLFVACMVCHGELVRRRSAVRHLTTFYLYIALGGALGGVFVNLLAPMLFTGFWELHIGLVSALALTGFCTALDNRSLTTGPRWLAFGGIYLISIVALTNALIIQVQSGREDSIYVTRGFFGTKYVDDWNAGSVEHQRGLYHGRIKHGKQLMHPSYQQITTSYYGVRSGGAAALRLHPARKVRQEDGGGLRVGLVGLGVGTMAAYARAGDSMRFYEIDPEVEDIARKYFSFLRNSKADIEVVLGDARISLQRELETSGSQQLDVLIIDAFSGDSIPMHLLTIEAFELFAQHLAEGGILALHISNGYVDLKPIARNAATHLGMQAIYVDDEGKRWYEDANDWILITANQEFLQRSALSEIDTPWARPTPRPIIWTDDFSNLIEVVDWID